MAFLFRMSAGALVAAVAACSVPNPWFGSNDARPGPDPDSGGMTTTTDPTGSGTTVDAPTDGTAETSLGPSTTDDSATDSSTTDVTTMDSESMPMAECGDEIVEAPEQCDDGNDDDHDDCLGTCVDAVCGDAILWQGVEACDDGNFIDDDGCTSLCALSSCGDGVVQPGEQCDDGNEVNADDCSNLCIVATCGDNVPQDNEQCDDGNELNDDECVECKFSVCGDGYVHKGVEQCDEQNDSNIDACTTQCKHARCGDGYIREGVEECDDGNVNNHDSCTAECKPAECGDGVIQDGEECDDGPLGNTSGCSQLCMNSALGKCGDDVVDPGEECDGEGGPLGKYPDLCTETCRMVGCLRIVNSPAADVGFKGNEWLTPCSKESATQVAVALFDQDSTLVYAAEGTRPGNMWTENNLTAGDISNAEQHHVGKHKYLVPLTSLSEPGKGGALMLTGRAAEPDQEGCFPTLGDGYGIGLFPDVGQPQTSRLLVMGYEGGRTGEPRLLAGWSPGAEISYIQAMPMDVCQEPPNLKGFVGKFVMAVF